MDYRVQFPFGEHMRGATMATQQPSLPTIDFSAIGPAVGTRFPDVVLPDQHGRMVDLHPATQH